MKTTRHKRILFISPWILAAAIGILTLIIYLLAANNIRREREHISKVLFIKGQNILRFVNASARASFIMGRQDPQSTQQLLEQVAEDQDILYIAVVTPEGNILAHSNPEKLGQRTDWKLPKIAGLEPFPGWRIREASEYGGKIFEVYGRLRPIRPGHEGTPGGRLRMMPRRPPRDCDHPSGSAADNDSSPANWWCRILGEDPLPAGDNLLILAGLNMNEFDKIEQQQRYQIFTMSILLFLIGLGGWVSLLTAQGYRVSQKALGEIKAFAGLLLARLPVGIIATDSNGKIMTCNTSAASMVGLSAPETLGYHPADKLPPAVAVLFQAEDGTDKPERELLLPAADNDLVLHYTISPIRDEQGNIAGQVLLLHDMTAVKKLEKDIRRHDRMAALGKMAAGVAHEVRNPLSSIKGFAALLGAKFQPESKEFETAQLMVQEVERLNRAITELLNFTRPLPLHLENVNLNEFVAKSLELIKPDADAMGIRIQTDFPAEIPAIMADKDKLNQVLLNLYLNGLQAMPANGTLTVTMDRDASAIRLHIIDTGCGITEEHLAKITDPYFTTKPEGTGLGLALGEKMIAEHGWTLEFASTPGKGTRASIIIPVGNTPYTARV